MKIVVITEWFSEKMGYAENCLPKALALLGHEVHLITTSAQVYYNDPLYEISYRNFLGPAIVDCGSKFIDGYTLHRLPLETIRGRILIKGLLKKLRQISPDIVQTFDGTSLSTIQCAIGKIEMGYKFYTANHIVASVFPLANEKSSFSIRYLIKRGKLLLLFSIPGRIVSLLTTRCYPATSDALDIAVRFMWVQKQKVKISLLGVDTEIFFPLSTQEHVKERLELRKLFGIESDEILCIYTGRFTYAKNPLCLAKAIHELNNRGEKYKAIFFGDGEQFSEIIKCIGCIIHPFVHFLELPKFYRIADIGVWPKQESTSVLDATSCGLPVIISDKVIAPERIEGNGISYKESNIDDMINSLLKLKEKELRKEMGILGIKKIRTQLSWDHIACQRVKDYEEAIKIK
jgi:glycosyltransferase involved in cell wall biosynthesis